MKQTWTPERIAYLREHYANRHNADLGRELGCTEVAIMGAARRYGAKKSAAYLASLPRGRRVPFKRPLFLSACADLIGRPTGACKGEMAAQAGVHPRNAHGFLHKALRAGELFSAGKLAQMRYFPTSKAAQAGAVLIAAEMAARRVIVGERKRARDRANYIPKPPRSKKAKALKPLRVKKIAAPKVKRPPKPPKPPKAPKPAKPVAPTKRGPAHHDTPADMTRATITRLPTPAGRYAVPDDFCGMFALAGIGRDMQTGNAWASA